MAPKEGDAPALGLLNKWIGKHYIQIDRACNVVFVIEPIAGAES